MLPSYVVPPEDIVEVAFAISELDKEADQQELSEFAGESKRKVRESIKVLREIGIVVGEEDHTLSIRFDDLIQQLPPTERNAVIEETLISYQPFIDYATYLNQDYSSYRAAKMVNTAHEISSNSDYAQKYLERLGEFAGILSEDDELTVEIRELPTDSTESIEKLRDALDSKLEVRVYLDEVLGEEVMAFLDEDTKGDLTEGFTKHATAPRASISATGRAIEDFLRNVGDFYGSNDRDYSSASGIIPVCNHLQGDNLLERLHKRRIFSIAEIRNKGGAHGDDAEKLERWDTSPEISLQCALSATLIIRSIYRYADRGALVL